MEKQNPSQDLTVLFEMVGQVSVFFEDHSYEQIKAISDKASEYIRRDVTKRDTPSVAKRDAWVDDVTKRDTISEAVRTLETLVNEFIPIFEKYYNH